MDVAFKETVWYNIDVPEEYEDKVQEALEEGKIQEANDLMNLLSEAVLEGEYMVDTAESITPEENNEQATIIALGEYEDHEHLSREVLFANGKNA